MPDEEMRAVVGVFDLRERAARAAAQLVSEGYEEACVRLVAPVAPSGCAALTDETGAYYAGESAAGRWLVVVLCRPAEVNGVTCAFGRNGGSVRVPPEIRDGTA